jgi:hypothetical protein
VIWVGRLLGLLQLIDGVKILRCSNGAPKPRIDRLGEIPAPHEWELTYYILGLTCWDVWVLPFLCFKVIILLLFGGYGVNDLILLIYV